MYMNPKHLDYLYNVYNNLTKIHTRLSLKEKNKTFTTHILFIN